MTDADLLRRFVATFETFDDLMVFDDMGVGESLPPEMDAGRDDSPSANLRWKVGVISTDRAALAQLYQQVPGPFPPLYEQLILSYRWFEIQLRDVALLLPNAPGPSLAPLAGKMTTDPTFNKILFPLGFVPFGRGAGGSYDPVCFDTRRRRKGGDCPIVRLEHESILCDDKIGDSWEIADSFRTLLDIVLSKAT